MWWAFDESLGCISLIFFNTQSSSAPAYHSGWPAPKKGKVSFHKNCHGLLLAPSIPSSHPHLAQMWLWLPDTQLLQGVRQLQHRYVLFFIVSLIDYNLSLEVALSKGWRRWAWAGQITVKKRVVWGAASLNLGYCWKCNITQIGYGISFKNK